MNEKIVLDVNEIRAGEVETLATMDSDWKASSFLFDQRPPPHLL